MFDIIGAPALQGSTPLQGSQQSSTSDGGDFDSTLSAFEKLINESPWQRMFEQVLKQHHLTEDQYNKLPAAQKEAIQKEVADDLKRMMKLPTSRSGSSLAALAEGVLGNPA